ncbi:hypothetical protein ACP70R_025281 [Stipagrostis hirtigluma subsp. patula]
MLVACAAAECAISVACARWAVGRLSLAGADDSASWPAASAAAFAPVPRACRAALSAYDDGAGEHPAPPPPSPLCPPYRLLHDRAHGEVVLAVRGLGLARVEDYRLLLDAGGPEPFAGGHAHRGLLRAAVWLLNREGPALRRMVAEAGPAGCRRLVFVGHSLGAGVAALAAVVAVRCWLGILGLRREDVRCYAMAPPRCMSLGLAVEYADVVHSVVLQDDFLPRTPAPLQHIFGSIFCLPCLLSFICMRDTFVSERKLTDPTKLYAPGRVFHIVERKKCRCGRFLPQALDLMEQEEELPTSPPGQQKMLRAQEAAQSLDVEEGTIGLHSIEHMMFLEETMQGDASSSSLTYDSPRTSTTSCSASSSMGSEQFEWGELVEVFLGAHDQDGDLLRRSDGENLYSVTMDYLPSRCK